MAVSVMPTPIVHLNGRFLPFVEGSLPLDDAAFVSGATVVDNVRTFRHKLFRWSAHLARFRRDCAACCVSLERSDEQITAVAEELVANNARLLPPEGELQVVTFATPGPIGHHRDGSTSGPPTLGMVTYPLPFERYRPFFSDGVTLAVVGVHPTDSTLLPPTIKHRSHLAWHLADHRARGPGIPLPLGFRFQSWWHADRDSIGHLLAVVNGTLRPRHANSSWTASVCG